MVRRQEHEHDDDNPNAKGSARGASAGLPLLARNAALRRPDSIRVVPYLWPKGRFAFTRATSVSWTRAILPSRRLRFELFVDNRWRREERDLKTFPRAVILKRFATDLRVLLRAMGFGIRRES